MSSQAAMLRTGAASVHYDHLLKLLLIGDSGACARDDVGAVLIAIEKTPTNFKDDAHDARARERADGRATDDAQPFRTQASARVACCCVSATISLRRVSSPP